jgi:hypothetical protein
MGVIGRLDNQVDELIIKPLSERNRQENSDTKTPSQPTAQPPQTEARSERTRDEEAKGAQVSDLPVWLL